MQYTDSTKKKKNPVKNVLKLKHKNLVKEVAPFQSILGWLKKLPNTSKYIDLAPKNT